MTLLEIAVTSVADAVAAQANGADRVELYSALDPELVRAAHEAR